MQQNNSIISFPFKGVIWKLLIDVSERMLVLEIRLEEERSVIFAGVDLSKKTLLWQVSNPAGDWWTGLDAVGEGNVYLYNYKDPQMPEHEGISVLKIRTGKEIWRDQKKTFLTLADGFVIASEGGEEDKRYFKIDPDTGKISGEIDTKTVFKARSAKSRLQNDEMKNSFHFSADSLHFQKIAGFVKQIINAEPVQGLDYFEFGEQVIISFYIYTQDGLINNLILIDEEGNVRFKDCIGTHLKGIALDTFFVFGDLLIYVKEKRELVLFKL